MFSRFDDEDVTIPVVDSDGAPVALSIFTDVVFRVSTLTDQELFKGSLNTGEIAVTPDALDVSVSPIDYVGPIFIESRVWFAPDKSKRLFRITSSIEDSQIPRG